MPRTVTSGDLPQLPRLGELVDRYRVVAEVAHGGMAAVYAVQRSSIGGFEKILALKVMLPHLATDAHFVSMFLDEARIASQIHHPHVVQVFDVGIERRLPFILMEFLRGKSLARVLDRAAEQDTPVPSAVWLSILARAAEGLHAAHETRDADGKPLGVVHRDVTPHNLLVGYDGQVKMLDFGIARARGRLVGTRSNELKGKFSYLAPEQIDRTRPVDRATDVWAFGVTAWETFAGKSLFLSDDEASTLWNVLNAAVPPLSQLRPDLPAAAAQAVMDCLNRSPARRTQSAAGLARIFDAAARELGGVEASDIAQVMERLFAAERSTEAARLAGAARPSVDPDLESAPTQLQTPASPVEAGTTDLTSSRVSAPQRSRLARVVVPALALAAAGLAGWLVMSSARAPAQPEPSPSQQLSVAVRPPAPPAPAASPERAPAPSFQVRVSVDPRTRVALVDGVRHDERPVVVSLAEGREAVVELIGPAGESASRVVRSSDREVVVRFEARPRGTVAKPAPKSSVKGPLLESPY
jgi:eukaryotic-like serine/threonine-protein kinase